MAGKEIEIKAPSLFDFINEAEMNPTSVKNGGLIGKIVTIHEFEFAEFEDEKTGKTDIYVVATVSVEDSADWILVNMTGWRMKGYFIKIQTKNIPLPFRVKIVEDGLSYKFVNPD